MSETRTESNKELDYVTTPIHITVLPLDKECRVTLPYMIMNGNQIF